MTKHNDGEILILQFCDLYLAFLVTFCKMIVHVYRNREVILDMACVAHPLGIDAYNYFSIVAPT